jgi:hypothetical protein
MRFLRSNQTAPPPPSPPSEHADREQLLLGQVSLLAAVVGALEQRCVRAEEALAAVAEQNRDLHPLLDRLGVLAGDVLPGVVAENSVLATRLAQGDRDLGLLTTALIGDLEPRAFESDNNDE